MPMLGALSERGHVEKRWGNLCQIDDYWEPSKKSLWGVGTSGLWGVPLGMFAEASLSPALFFSEDPKMLDRLLGRRHRKQVDHQCR